MYDAIVVGARCAGASTAMLLARRGKRVLLVDRAAFPSDTMSTHLVHPPGIAALERWGLRERLEATGCPPIETYAFDFGPFTLAGSPHPADGVSAAYAPRRTVLDKLLVDAAVEAGVELREEFTLDSVVVEGGRALGIRGHARGRRAVTEEAALVVGADGRRSRVARDVEAEAYDERPALAATYYAYWSGVPVSGLEVYVRPDRSFGAMPTHDGLTTVVVSWPMAEFAANKRDVEGNYLRTLDLAPTLADRIRRGRRESRFVGSGDLDGFFRTPYGPGWALAGDATYHKDPCTAQGISDAFRDAEAIAAAASDPRGFEAAMAAYQSERDHHVGPLYEFTCELASLAPPPPEQQELLAAVHGDQRAMDEFASVIAGTLSPSEFFSPASVERILTRA